MKNEALAYREIYVDITPATHHYRPAATTTNATMPIDATEARAALSVVALGARVGSLASDGVGRGVDSGAGRGVGANTGAAVGLPGVAVGPGVGLGVDVKPAMTLGTRYSMA